MEDHIDKCKAIGGKHIHYVYFVTVAEWHASSTANPRVPGSNPGGGLDFFLGLKGAPELTQLCRVPYLS